MADAFEVLGLDATAGLDEVRAAYRRLARIYHPDRHAEAPVDVRTEAERRMQELNLAYEAIQRGDGGRHIADVDRTSPAPAAPKTRRAQGRPQRPKDEIEREAMYRKWDELERRARAQAERQRQRAAAEAAAAAQETKRRAAAQHVKTPLEIEQERREAADRARRKREMMELELRAARERAAAIKRDMEATYADREEARRRWLEEMERTHGSAFRRLLRLGK